MITVEAARARVAAKVASQGRAWAAEPWAAAAASATVALHPPAEREALAQQAAVIAWRDAWAAAEAEPGVALEWATRSWSRVGAQRVPVRVAITGADALARFGGRVAASSWSRLRDRAATALAVLGEGEPVVLAVRAHATALAGYEEAEFATLREVARWLAEHEVQRLRPRELPIRGVDSKWFGAHRAVVSSLALAASGRETLGIAGDAQQHRVRFLDERIAPGAPRACSASVDELAAMPVTAPSGLALTVLVLENLESLLSMPAMPAVVAVHGMGYSAAELARVPWIADARVRYWGDLDSNGFAILHRLRTALPGVRSVLMDDATLLAHRDLWVPEPKPARGAFATLDAAEQEALERLRDEGDVRLEQERIPWAFALDRLGSAIAE